MGVALALMSHPDGQIALLNDAALGIFPSPGHLGIKPASEGTFELRDSGYFGTRTSAGHYLICDAGPVGPDYLLGHAHGDIFSFELSLGGSRAIVDSGVFSYEPDSMRAYCRSTKAHNTVEIGGVDQCEFWGTFRVARRGRPSDVSFEITDNGFRLSGRHDGYRRLAGRPVHHRTFLWKNEGVLAVRDRVDSSRQVEVVSRIHLHPDCDIIELGERMARIGHSSGDFVVAWTGNGVLTAEDSWYCPEFGIRQKNRALAFRGSAPCETAFCVALDEALLSFDA